MAACGIPSTAPKTSFWSNCVLFGAVVGSVIGCLWNSVHSPENELLEQLSAFRGCGRICHWLLVEFRPQPRKRAFGAFLCFSVLWRDLSSTCPIEGLLLEFRPQPRKQAFAAILCFSGLWQDLTSTFCIHWLLLEFRPQPRQRAFGAILCFSGLWQDLTSTFCIDCHDCRQNPVQNPDGPGPDPNTRTRPGPDRANPDLSILWEVLLLNFLRLFKKTSGVFVTLE